MSPADISALNEQIAAMAQAGLPLDQGLALMAADMPRGRLRTVTRTLAGDLKTGLPLDKALAKQSQRLPQYYPALVAAGIRTGRLPQVLAMIAQYTRFIGEMRASIVDALIYPFIIMLVGLGLFSVCTYYVLPQFREIFREFGLKLPWFTQVALGAADYPFLAFAVAGIVVGGVLLLVLASRYSPWARAAFARALYRVPLAGTAVHASRLNAFASLLAILVEYEVPLPEAFRLAGQGCPDPIMAGQAETVAADLEHGIPLATALAGRGLVPEWMSWMSGLGESQNRLDSALREVAGVYRKQVESRTAIFRGVLPSFIILLVAGVIGGFYVLAIITPMLVLLEGFSR